jgi:hypothetical protein
MDMLRLFLGPLRRVDFRPTLQTGLSKCTVALVTPVAPVIIVLGVVFSGGMVEEWKAAPL